MSRSKVDIGSSTREERLTLLEEIWDSLEPTDVPLTEAQRDELDRRLDDLERDPTRGIPWEDVLREIRERGRRTCSSDPICRRRRVLRSLR